MTDPVIKLPNRFESILNAYESWRGLIFPVEGDLVQFKKLARRVAVQDGGVLQFLVSPSGAGKTTAVYAASVHLSDEFSDVLRVPPEVPLREIISWLQEQGVSPPERGIRILLFDGREETDDTTGLKQFLAGLNQFLRGNPRICALWPMTDPAWNEAVLAIAQRIGGKNFAPGDPIAVAGPDASDWPEILDRLLAAMDFTTEDLALDSESIRVVAESEKLVGDFLTEIRDLIASRVSDFRIANALPTIFFLISAGDEVAGEANRIRKGGSYLLRGDELLRYSAKSENGRWWKARSKDKGLHLGWVVSLFNARLFTLSPAAVATSVLHFGKGRLRDDVEATGISSHPWNRTNSIRSSDLTRFLSGEEVDEITSSKKGSTADATLAAFDIVQARSSKEHKSINQAIGAAYGKDSDVHVARYEVDLGQANMFADAELKVGDALHVLECHHLSAAQCKASKMANYIMGKLKSYAVHYNIAEP